MDFTIEPSSAQLSSAQLSSAQLSSAQKIFELTKMPSLNPTKLPQKISFLDAQFIPYANNHRNI